MNFRPLHDRICVEPIEQESQSAGGIIIPETAKDKPMEGKVLAVGAGRKTEDGTLVPVDIKEGDQVLYGRFSGSEVTIEGQKVLIMRESDIMGIIE